MPFRRFLFFAVTFSVYVACAAYLLLRAEGFDVTPDGTGLVETAIVSVQLAQEGTVALADQRAQGSTAFNTVPPGRHIVSVVAADGRRAEIAVEAVARRVTALESVHLPETALVGGSQLATRATEAALSSDGRTLAVIRDASPATVVLSSVLAPAHDELLSIPLPELQVTGIAWLGPNLLCLTAQDEVLLLRVPGTIERIPLPGAAAASIHATQGGALLRLEDGSVHALSAGGRLTKVADAVTAVVRTRGELLLAHGASFRSLDGALTLPPMPEGVEARGMARRGADVIAWDAHGQGWILRVGAGWQPFRTGLAGEITRPDGPLLLLGDGEILDAYGDVLLRTSGPIDEVLDAGAGRVLVRSGENLSDCGLTLRRCDRMASNVDQAWVSNGSLIVRQEGSVRMFALR